MVQRTPASDPGDVGFIDSGALAAGVDAFRCSADRHPFATFAIYRNRLILSSPLRRTYEFAPGDITRIALENSLLLAEQIRIVHTRSDYPAYIAFSPLNPDLVLDGLRRVGYSVEATI